MKTYHVLAALSALLAGCASFLGGADPARPAVGLDLSKPVPTIRVDQPVLNFPANQGKVLIVWRLQKELVEGARKYRFDRQNGIVIVGEITATVLRGSPGRPDSIVLDPAQKEIGPCSVIDDGLAYSCVNEHRRPGLYKYTITLSGEGPPLVLDPVIANW